MKAFTLLQNFVKANYISSSGRRIFRRPGTCPLSVDLLKLTVDFFRANLVDARRGRARVATNLRFSEDGPEFPEPVIVPV